MSFTIGSLFDGSGGFPLAATLCGGVPKWASEVEPYPIAVTKSRFPNVKHLGSVTDIKGVEVEPVDVITFGSPCQDLSVAGKRAGLKHEANGDDETTRSGLFMEAVRIIKEMREATNGVYPRFALWENVPGAFSSNKGEDFRIVLEELIKIVEPTAVMPTVPKAGWPYADSYCGDGWSLAYRVLDAQFWGVPQRRRRIYLVLDLRGECAEKVSFEREGLRGYFETGRTPWKTTTGDVEGSSGTADCEGKCYGVGADLYNQALTGDKAATLSANSCMTATRNGPSVIQAVGCDMYNLAVTGEVAASLTTATGQGASNTGPSVVVPVCAIDQQGGKGGANYAVDVMPTLCSDSHGTPHAVAYGVVSKGNGEAWPIEEKHMALSCGGGQAGQGYPCVMQPIAVATQQGGAEITTNGICPTITAAAGMSGNNQPWICTKDQYVYCIDQGGGKSSANYYEELAPTLTCTHGGEPVVTHSTKLASGSEIMGNLCAVEAERGPRVIGKEPPYYIVRRLTPTECARLQGFPDTWGHPIEKTEFTDEEYQFWLNVRNTHSAINDKPTKEYTKDQILNWYNGLHTDSSEYKMWGNGIALPNALYVMQGIADAMSEEKAARRKWLDDLLGDCL